MNTDTVLKNFLVIIMGVLIVIIFWGAFTVKENQVAVITDNYMNNKPMIHTTGLYWHIPLVQNVDYVYVNQHSSLVYFANKLQTLDGESITLHLLVDWSVVQPITYSSDVQLSDSMNLDIIFTRVVMPQVESIVATINLAQLNQNLTLNESVNIALAKYGMRINDWNITSLVRTNKAENNKVAVTNNIQDIAINNEISVNELNIESAFNEANKIKTETLIEEATIYKGIKSQNPKLYDYMRKIDIYRQTSKSKADTPPLNEIYR